MAKALDLWIELTGVDPTSTSFSMRGWEVHKMNRQIKEALELDETEITAYLLLDAFSRAYFKERVFFSTRVATVA
ncbi:MAG: hypothetical protein A4E57_01293 [Syntrophorhabdaceae bacterium PtaU1.Bin034]|nr:MAG: hypothetical protein A4E57_01293 [Syntrophorhabdaceae bacterium PtaU1.Bin034]